MTAQRVQEYIERTYLPGELFTVYQIADALDQWKPRPQSKRLSAQSVERPVRAMLNEGLLWRFVDVEWRDQRYDERVDEPHAGRYVRFALALKPPTHDERTKKGSASVKERFGLR